MYPHHLIKPIIQSTEEPILQQSQNMSQPKKASKVSFSDSRPHNKYISIPQARSRDNSRPKTINRENIWSTSREILPYPDAILSEIPLQETLRKLTDLDTEIKTDFEENSPYQEGFISETYQRPNGSYFQDPQN